MIIETISDIHFGARDNSEKLYNELKNSFISHCNEIHPDLIVICGDCYDKRVLIDSDANIYLNKFIHDCIDTGATIIIFEGTDSHDRHQINSFAHYVSDKFFIINTVKEINVCGLNCLILPEEYVRDHSYYDDYINDNKKYDFVFGHGMFKHVSFNSIENKEYSRKPFTFDYLMFKDLVKYYVVFGHIHIHSEYKNKIIYNGSFSRLNFGEEEPKGWYEFDLNTKKGKCEYKFIENTFAPLFRTIQSSELPEETELLLNQLRGYSESNDYLRINIDCDISDAKYNTIYGFVKNHLNTVVKRKIKQSEEINTTKEINQSVKEKQEILNNKMKEYKGLNFYEITQKMAKENYNENIDQDYINKVLNTQI